LVAVITQLGKYKANGKMGRTQLRRLWTYMTGFNVLLPTFWLASIDGLVTLYYAGTLHDMFTRLYLPAAAIFFVNFLIQRTLLKGVVDMLRLQDVIMYLWHIRRRFWGKIMTPMELLKASELGDFNIEREYVFMLVTFVMIFVYSLYSPIVLLCGFFYIFVKHYIDRYVILYVYGHKAALNEMKKQGSSATEMFKTDFSTHHKRVELVSKIFVFDVFLFFAFLAIYFGNKIHDNKGFIVHTVIMSLMAALSLAIMFAMMVFYNKKKKRLRTLAGKKELRRESAAVKLAYEPPQSFLRDLQYKAEHGDSEEKVKEELKQLEKMQRSKRIRQYHFRDVGCYVFNKFIPLRIICEQTLETCCNNTIDSLFGFIWY
jgi:ABC-type multidrug transport system fused ATPase/permease subunit